MATLDNTSIFPKGEKLSNAHFTGNAFLHSLLAKDKNNGFALESVTFEPGARTHWHTHPKGQVFTLIALLKINSDRIQYSWIAFNILTP